MNNVHQAELNKILIKGCRTGDVKLVMNIVENGADINFGENLALIEALFYGDLNIVKYLVGKGADVNAQDNKGLALAASSNHLDIVKYLIVIEKDINMKNIKSDISLRYASRHEHIDIIKYLISEQNCDPEIAREEAMAYDNYKIVEWCNSYINSRDLKNKLSDELVNNDFSSQKKKI